MTGIAVTVGVAVLGALGAVGRYTLARWGNAAVGGWPIGTLAANTAAAFALGIVHNRFGSVGTAVAVGLLGSLSTWSTLAIEIVDRARAHRWVTVVGYVGATMVLGIGGAFVGLQL